MSGHASLQPLSQTRRAPAVKIRAVSALHPPSQNRILAALPAHDYERLLPDLQPVSLPRGWTVYKAGGRQTHLYFPTAGIISKFSMLENGALFESAITGNEGVIGAALFLGGASTTLSQTTVISAGYAYRLRADLLQSEFRRDGALQRLLLRHTMAVIAQTGQNSACARHHAVDQQLCCWLLSCLDRLDSNVLDMTQELIADMLGVRRESVTAAAGRLQTAGLIRYQRGHITVLDRPQLEKRACECYTVVKREHDRLLPVQRAYGAHPRGIDGFEMRVHQPQQRPGYAPPLPAYR